ncbi:MAG: Cof-type HAD-IIB family hydrolase [Butyrivibrio sp.]
MDYKVLAFDIDGTLVNSDKKITPATKDAIQKAADKGCRVVIASGRPVQGIRRYAKELNLKEHNGYILAYNGGALLRCSDGAHVKEKMLPRCYYEEIYLLAKECGVNIMTYDGDDVISENTNDKYLRLEAGINGLGIKEVPDLLAHLTYEVPKFLMLGDGDYLAEVEKKVYRQLHDRMDVYRSEPFFLEIMPKGINKASGLSTLLNEIGATREELMTFGDGYNDLSMIKYAGMGVAMSNGNDTVKAEADFIAPSNDNDGIAYTLEKFVLD